MARLAGIPGVRILPPEGGFFAMADARDLRIPSPEIRRRPGGEGTLRISFASGGDTLARGLGRLREGLTRIAESAA